MDQSSRSLRFPISLAQVGTQRVVFWIIVILLGLNQAWSHRLLVDHDGVAYLDVADYYAHGAWNAALNNYYSPLYSWLIAFLEFLVRFPLSWESTFLHLVNFVGYLGAYATFEFLLKQLLQTEQATPDAQNQSTGLSDGAWRILGLGLFLYSSLTMANLSGHSGQGDPGSTPDIFVLLFVFLAAGLLFRMDSGQARSWTYILFGVTLAFGYFAKTAMFPLSFVFLAVAGFLSLRQRKVGVFLLAPLCFALVAGPWLALLSHDKGRLVYGDAGRLTYRWLVGPRANPVEWAGQTQPGETLFHPPRQLSENPPIYEFASPVPGTFPLWYGSSYWLEGKFPFSLAGQIRILRQSYSYYWDILDHQKEFLVLLLVLIVLQGTLLGYLKSLFGRWILWLPALAALAMYATVRVEPRYVAAFLMLLWISLFSAVRLPKMDSSRHFTLCAVSGAVLAVGLGILHGSITDFHAILRGAPSEQKEVAAGLSKMGITEGQALATIGIPRDSFYWARLARVRVVSEIPSPNVNQYWFGSSETQQKVRAIFAQTGAVAIVTDTVPSTVAYPESGETLRVPGWQQIGSTSYYLFPLHTESSAHSASVESAVPHLK
jgi:4-amino-4-deoxy-L-arabinose transferase-like glycosyltransferase